MRIDGHVVSIIAQDVAKYVKEYIMLQGANFGIMYHCPCWWLP